MGESKTPAGRIAFKASEVAKMVGLTPRTIQRLAESGDLRSVRLGGCLLIPADEVDRLAGRQPAAAA